MFQVLLRSFGANYAIRVIGLCSGFGAKILISIGFAYLPNSPLFKILNDYPTYYYSFVLASLLMLPVAFGHKGIPEGVAQNIKTIEALLEAAKSTKPQRTFVWLSLIQKYLEAVQPNFRAEPKIKLTELANEEINAQIADAKDKDY